MTITKPEEGDWIPLKTAPISKFKELIVKFFGVKSCTHKGNDYYIYKGQAFCIKSQESKPL